MDSKYCNKCGITKPVDQFRRASNRADGRQTQCTVCMNITTDVWRRKNIEQVESKRKQRVASTKELFNDWKSKQQCFVCKEDTIPCLDFHHMNPAEKDYSISDMIGTLCWKTIQREISKCVVLCANCHRKHHAGLLDIITVDGNKLVHIEVKNNKIIQDVRKNRRDARSSKNSQYDTRWVTKHHENKKVKQQELDKYLMDGWIIGRTVNPLLRTK